MRNWTHLRTGIALILIAMAATPPAIAQSSPGAPSSPKTGAVALTEKDTDKTARATVGQLVTISLAANPTTGYSWTLSGNYAPLKLLKSDYAGDAAKQGAIGAGGTQTIQFLATEEGTARVVLEYRRPWENDPPARTFKVTVNVEPCTKPAVT